MMIYVVKCTFYESNTETGRIYVMKGSRQVLVKVVLFQLRGRGHPQGKAMPNFFPDSKSSILGLSNEVSFVIEFFLKDQFHIYLEVKAQGF